MRYKKFGNTGLFVSELCLGTMTFGGEDGMRGQIGKLRQDDVDGLIGCSLDAGINFIDTADVYADGRSEIMTGQALKNLQVNRENVVVATKVFGEAGTKGQNSRGMSRYHIIDALKGSLKRLQLDHVDLYQIHGFDPATPIEEAVRAFDTLVQQGHVRYIGVSNWAAWQIMKALGISERLGLARFESLQAYYTIASRDIERELVPLMKSENVGLMVWSPLAGGLLSGKYGRDRKAEEGSRRTHFDFPVVNLEHAYDCIDVMRKLADDKSISVAQIAIAWLLHQSVVTSVIVGAKRVAQLDDNIAATNVQLSTEELAQLDEVSKLKPEYPAWMLERMGGYRRQQLANSKRN
ncbi:MAG TPA: aldo/keto reductase [Rhodocyclaceae bacterium]|nr:aldo/keto reductase [Rhodocyclaceae bacterium]